jgi:thioredoxin reductase (NADPH)
MVGTDYDLVIAGGGPAGLTAGLYATRAKLKTLLIEKMVIGGQAASTFLIDNYPGFPEGISGPELAQAMEKQAKRFGLEISNGDVHQVLPRGKIWEIEHDGNKITSRAVIITTGVDPKKLGVPGEDEMKGRGVSYCATCDGPFFRDEEIAVIGGGDAAVDEAIYLTRFAKRIYLIHRRNGLRAAKVSQDQALANEKIKILWDTVVERISGEKNVTGLELKNVKTLQKSNLKVAGVFLYVGWKPHTEFLKGIVPLDEQGFIVTDAQMATSVPGLFAAGDVRQKLLRQITTAVGDGATAAFAAERYLEAFSGS